MISDFGTRQARGVNASVIGPLIVDGAFARSRDDETPYLCSDSWLFTVGEFRLCGFNGGITYAAHGLEQLELAR